MEKSRLDLSIAIYLYVYSILMDMMKTITIKSMINMVATLLL